MIEVELPDGSIAEFPDGTPPDAMKQAISKRFPPQAAPSAEMQTGLAEMSAMTQNPAKAQYEALPAWQKPLVAAGDIAQLAGSGLMYGFGEKGAAALRAPFTEKTYEEELAEQRRLTQGARKRSGGAGTTAEIAGGIAGPLKLAGRGGTLSGRLGTAEMAGAKGLGARSALMGAEGAGYGTLHAAGNDQDLGEGALTGALSGVLGNVGGEALSGLLGTVGKAFSKKQPVPSIDELRNMKTAAYQSVDDAGVQYAPGAFNDLVKGMTDEMKAANISPMRHPKAASMMTDIQALADSSPTLTQLDQLRQTIARDVSGSTDPAERFFGKKMIANIDEFIDAAGPEQVVSGRADDAARAIRDARSANQRFRKSEMVSDATTRAENRAASTGSGGNVDNTIRQNIRSILDSPKKSRGFTADERAAMEKIVRGTAGQNALRLAGKLSPSGNGLMAALGVGGAMVNPLVGAASLGGMGAKSIADRMTGKNVQELMDLVATGGSRSALRGSPNALQKLSKDKREAFSRALMALGVNIDAFAR